MLRVGVAGLGYPGRPVAQRLRQAGFRVIGYDSDLATAATSGLRTTGSISRLTNDCDVLVAGGSGEPCCALVEELLLTAGQLGRTLLLVGRVGPDDVRALARAAQERAVPLLDCAIAGGERAILAGAATVFAAGEELLVDQQRQLLGTLGKVLYVGHVGAGQVARATNDLLQWSSVVAAYEAFQLASSHDVDLSRLRDAIVEARTDARTIEALGSQSPGDGEDEVSQALVLRRSLNLEMPFLSRMAELLPHLDQQELSKLFDAGIADLSTRDGVGLGNAGESAASHGTEDDADPLVSLLGPAADSANLAGQEGQVEDGGATGAVEA